MTCVIAVARETAIQMAGDALITSGGFTQRTGVSKIWPSQGAFWGAAGSTDYCSAMRFRFPQLHVGPDGWDDRFMHTHFMEAARKAVAGTSWREHDDSGELLVAFWRDQQPVLYELTGLTAFRVAERYAAIGSGREAAVGAMAYVDHHIWVNHLSIETVMQVAATHARGVGAISDLLTLDRPHATLADAPLPAPGHTINTEPVWYYHGR